MYEVSNPVEEGEEGENWLEVFLATLSSCIDRLDHEEKIGGVTISEDHLQPRKGLYSIVRCVEQFYNSLSDEDF